MNRFAVFDQLREFGTGFGRRPTATAQRCASQLLQQARFAISRNLVHPKVPNLHTCLPEGGRSTRGQEGLVVEDGRAFRVDRNNQAESLQVTNEAEIGSGGLGQVACGHRDRTGGRRRAAASACFASPISRR